MSLEIFRGISPLQGESANNDKLYQPLSRAQMVSIFVISAFLFLRVKIRTAIKQHIKTALNEKKLSF